VTIYNNAEIPIDGAKNIDTFILQHFSYHFLNMIIHLTKQIKFLKYSHFLNKIVPTVIAKVSTCL